MEARPEHSSWLCFPLARSNWPWQKGLQVGPGVALSYPELPPARPGQNLIQPATSFLGSSSPGSVMPAGGHLYLISPFSLLSSSPPLSKWRGDPRLHSCSHSHALLPHVALKLTTPQPTPNSTMPCLGPILQAQAPREVSGVCGGGGVGAEAERWGQGHPKRSPHSVPALYGSVPAWGQAALQTAGRVCNPGTVPARPGRNWRTRDTPSPE